MTFAAGRIDAELPRDVMDKLLRIPNFERACAADGYARAEYDSLPGLVTTAEEFSGFTGRMVEFAASCLGARAGS